MSEKQLENSDLKQPRALVRPPAIGIKGQESGAVKKLLTEEKKKNITEKKKKTLEDRLHGSTGTRRPRGWAFRAHAVEQPK